ncbi:hypothetical protein [Halorussus halobius]|uniref:hypothetical protein n=1 Tax=Halorussus halobius TaxID=1710537 RepID=UPI00143DDD1E|nr:hypothetical protein [Halorussus halobius]
MNPTQSVESHPGTVRDGDSLESAPVERAAVVQFGPSHRLAGSDSATEPDGAPRDL